MQSAIARSYSVEVLPKISYSRNAPQPISATMVKVNTTRPVRAGRRRLDLVLVPPELPIVEP